MVVYNVEKSNVLMQLQTYCDVQLKVSNKYFEFLKKRFSTNNSFVYFILAIVLSVLLRYTNSDYHFGIFKLFLSWIRVITKLPNSEQSYKGYKIFDKEYFHLNYFLTILAFTIYKSYYVSEQKTKTIDVYLLFKNEFQRKMKENKLLGMNSLFNHILNKLWS